MSMRGWSCGGFFIIKPHTKIQPPNSVFKQFLWRKFLLPVLYHEIFDEWVSSFSSTRRDIWQKVGKSSKPPLKKKCNTGRNAKKREEIRIGQARRVQKSTFQSLNALDMHEEDEELVWCSLPVEVEGKKPQESKFTNTKDHYLHDPQDPSNWEIWEREEEEEEVFTREGRRWWWALKKKSWEGRIDGGWWTRQEHVRRRIESHWGGGH